MQKELRQSKTAVGTEGEGQWHSGAAEHPAVQMYSASCRKAAEEGPS